MTCALARPPFRPVITLGLLLGAWLSSHATPPVDVVEGTLRVAIVDNLVANESRRIVELVDAATGEVLRLRYAGSERLVSGRQVTVLGRRTGEATFDASEIIDPKTFEAALHGSSESDSAEVFQGEQRVAIVPVQYVDAPLWCSLDSIGEIMFGSGGVADLYVEVSYGQLSFSGTQFPTITLPTHAPTECTGRDISIWTPYIEEQLGPFDEFNRVLYVWHPPPCSVAGVAEIGSPEMAQTWAVIYACEFPLIYAHELGHNFGMHHASHIAGSEYGDDSDFMGGAWWYATKLAAPHVDMQGWLDRQYVRELSAPGFYQIRLSALGLPEEASTYEQILRIPTADAQRPLYFSFRNRHGFDSGLVEPFPQRVSVHSSHTRYLDSWLHGTLGVGEVYADSDNGIFATHVTPSATSTVLQVRIDPENRCLRTTPSVGLEALATHVRPAGTIDFDVSITNNDDPQRCPDTDFTVRSTLPPGFLSNAPVVGTIPAGATDTFRLTMTASNVEVSRAHDFILVVSDIEGDRLHLYTETSQVHVDARPPTRPVGLSAMLEPTGGAQLSWHPASDTGAGVTHYVIWRDLAEYASSPTASYVDRQVMPGRTYVYQVQAVDGVALRSALSDFTAFRIPWFGGGSTQKVPAASRGRVELNQN